MAKISLAGTIAALAGRVGGIVFSLGPAGPMSVIGSAPGLNRTSAQKASTQAFTSMIKAWKNATTPTQRAGWRSFANANPITNPCGDPVKLTGAMAFTRSNRRLASIKAPRILSAPGSFTAGGPLSISLSYTAGSPPSLTVSATNAPAAAEVPVISARGPMRAGRNAAADRTFQLTYETAGSTGPWEIASLYTGRYGAFISGTKVSVTVRYLNNSSGAYGAAATAQIIIP